MTMHGWDQFSHFVLSFPRSASASSVWAVWNLCLQLIRSWEKSVHDSGAMLKSYRSCLSTSLNLRRGLPTHLVPFSNTPCRIWRGIRWRGMRLTWPAHRSRRNFNLDDSGPEPVTSNISSLVILSFQVFPRINLRLRVWNALSLDSWGRYVVQLSAP